MQNLKLQLLWWSHTAGLIIVIDGSEKKCNSLKLLTLELEYY